MPIPNFFVVGAPKAGTTALYAFLDQHPQVFMCPLKEPNYFADELRLENFALDEQPRLARETRALEDYLRGDLREKRFGGLVSSWEDYVSLFRNASTEIALGEASACYLWSPSAPGNIAARIQRYRDMEAFTVIGRGFNYATAFELALKLKELTYTQAIAYSSADFRHGPVATTAEGSPVILMMPGGAAYADLYELALDLRQREADLLVISDAPDALALATTPLPLAVAVSEWLSPLTTILPGQMLALQLTLARGLNPDAPRGLHKVTRTL